MKIYQHFPAFVLLAVKTVFIEFQDGASIGLSRREEVELTRALYASLQTQKQKNKPTAETATNEDDVAETSRDGKWLFISFRNGYKNMQTIHCVALKYVCMTSLS